MFIIKSKNKRKNLITALAMLLFVVGGVVLDTQLSKKEPLSDCSCTEQIQVQQQREAGWFFGKHKNSNTGMCETRFFGFTIKSECVNAC